MSEMASTLLGLLQGYLLVPIFQLGFAAGPWLAGLWGSTVLKVTAVLNSLMVIAACLALELFMVIELGTLVERGDTVGSGWARGFFSGVLLFGAIPAVESKLRKKH